MEGVKIRTEAGAEAALLKAYQTGAFSGLAYHGKLKRFSAYNGRSDTAQKPGEMLAALKTMGAGSNMKVRRVKLDRKPEP